MSLKNYRNGNKFGFTNGNIKIEFREPSIQAHDEYGYVKGPRDILYYYYSVVGYAKTEYSKKWKEIFSIHTYDFPHILSLKAMLEAFIEKPINRDEYQKLECSNFGTYYSYNMETGFVSDDAYSLTHTIFVNGDGSEKSTYSLSVGKGCSSYTNVSLVNLTLNHLTRKELCKIYECVKGFVKYTCDVANERIRDYVTKDLMSWKISDGKLYQMNEDCSIKSVFTVSDMLNDVTVIEGNINSKNYHSACYNNCRIVDIKDNSIVIEGGFKEYARSCDYEHLETSEEIAINTIAYIFPEMPEERLNFGEDEIMKDFISILSDEEIEEFKTADVDFLFNKWKSAIIDRTWMCRSEHNLPKRAEDDGNHANVYASVRVIIENIKNYYNN